MTRGLVPGSLPQDCARAIGSPDVVFSRLKTGGFGKKNKVGVGAPQTNLWEILKKPNDMMILVLFGSLGAVFGLGLH